MNAKFDKDDVIHLSSPQATRQASCSNYGIKCHKKTMGKIIPIETKKLNETFPRKPTDNIVVNQSAEQTDDESAVSRYSENSYEKKETAEIGAHSQLRKKTHNNQKDNPPTKTKKGCCSCFGFKKTTENTEESGNNLENTKQFVAGGGSNSAATDETNDPNEVLNIMSIHVPVNDLHKDEESSTDNMALQVPMVRRKRIADKPNISLSLWGILKNFIGKDITKVSLPVNFSEPLSMLQRLTEDFEYSNILFAAAEIESSVEQMAYVAAFTISSYASTTVRTGKPFNPLLGETFECDRSKDFGWRCFSEQISHHPPTVSQHCEAKTWTCWQQFTMVSKITINSLSFIPLGTAHLLFPRSSNHYTWRKITTCVHNLTFGKLWVGQEGEMDIINHTTNDRCHLIYAPPSGFSGNDAPKKITGEIFNKNGELKWKVMGLWDSSVDACEVLHVSPERLGPKRTLWKRVNISPEAEKYYNFSALACELNEIEPGIAPTDSRLRPDQRLMEDGSWDEANVEKRRLEEKQRAAASLRKKATSQVAVDDGGEPGYKPLWFNCIKDPLTNMNIHVYNGEYWPCKNLQKWERCPDIY